MADNGTKIRIFFMQIRGLAVLETNGPQVVSNFPSCPDYGEGSVGTKDFFYFKMPRPALGPNLSYIQCRLGLSLLVDRPGRKVDRPKLRMSGPTNPLLLYAFMLWTGITLHIIYRCGAPGSPQCTHGNLVQ
jgi:hypothetical protein